MHSDFPRSPSYAMTSRAFVRRLFDALFRREKLTAAQARRLEKQLKDFSGGGLALFWQRQGIYLGAALMCGFYFNVLLAIQCYGFCQCTEMMDTYINNAVMRWKGRSPREARMFRRRLFATSAVSAIAVAHFAIQVAHLEGPANHFTSLFFLFAAGLFAAVNNHQLPSVLAVRLVIYGAAFLYIPLIDIFYGEADLQSKIWLHFLTVVFVLFFVLECSMIFLRLYRSALDQLDELRIERDRAKEIYELKSQFVSVVSHELRTPLTSIIGSLGLLKSSELARNPESAEKILEIAHKNSTRLSKLINDLLDLQKLESDTIQYSFGPVDPCALLEDSAEAISAHAKSREVRVEVAACDKGPEVYADYDRMMQVIDNLMSNAVKFSEKGGLVQISSRKDGKFVRIEVRDQGVGIPEGSRDLVFGKFSQVDSSDHRAHEGTGLGLSIAARIVEEHGGQVDYDSVLGEGTCFYVKLPIFTAEGERDE